MRVSFKAKSLAEIKKKIAAFRVLFDVEPTLWVDGNGLDAKDDDWFWLHSERKVKIRGKFLIIDFGSEGTGKIDPSDEANDGLRYSLQGG